MYSRKQIKKELTIKNDAINTRDHAQYINE